MLQKNNGNVKKILNFCFVISLSIAALLFFISSIMFSYDVANNLGNDKLNVLIASFRYITSIFGFSFLILSFIFFEWNIFLDAGKSPHYKSLLLTIISSTLLLIGTVLFLISQILDVLDPIKCILPRPWYTSVFFCLSLPCIICIILGFIIFFIFNIKKYAKWKIIFICILLLLLLFLPFAGILLEHDTYIPYLPFIFDLFTYSLLFIIFLFSNIGGGNRYKIHCDKITLIAIGIAYCLWIINLSFVIHDPKYSEANSHSPFWILLTSLSFLFTASVTTYAVGNILNIKSKK